MSLATVPEAVADIKEGKFVIVVDDEDRENEGDLVVAAERITPDHISFMTRHGSGLVCMPIRAKRLDELGIAPMMPGHTFPLRAAEGGTLTRAGQTEAAVDLATLANLYPAGVITELMKPDGTMARMPDIEEFAQEHDIKIITVEQLIAYRRRNEKLVARRVEAQIPINDKAGAPRQWTLYAYEDLLRHENHLAIVLGNIDEKKPTLLRAHSECLTGDIFGSLRCDCGAQLKAAMEQIAQEGTGVILYIRHQEGRGIGLLDKLHAYNLQDEGLDTVEANEALGHPPDKRDYGIGSQILYDLGVRKIRLLTNNPKKIYGLEGFGLEVVERVPIKTQPNQHNERYLKAKKDKLGHLL